MFEVKDTHGKRDHLQRQAKLIILLKLTDTPFYFHVVALAVPVSVGVGLALLFVTALFLLVCNCLWCHYNRRKKKNYISAPVVEYDRSGKKQELELMSESEVLPQEGCRNRTVSNNVQFLTTLH